MVMSVFSRFRFRNKKRACTKTVQAPTHEDKYELNVSCKLGSNRNVDRVTIERLTRTSNLTVRTIRIERLVGTTNAVGKHLTTTAVSYAVGVNSYTSVTSAVSKVSDVLNLKEGASLTGRNLTTLIDEEVKERVKCSHLHNYSNNIISSLTKCWTLIQLYQYTPTQK